MKNWFPELPEETKKRKQNAYRITVILLVILVLFDVYSTINYFGHQNSQLLFAMLLSYAATITTLTCLWLLHQNRVNAATWGLILTTLVSLLISPLLGSGLGLIYGVTAVFFTAVIAGQALESHRIARANSLGLVVGIAIYLLDISLPASAAGVAAGSNRNATTSILCVMLLALLIVIVRQFRDYSIRTKLIILFLTVSIIPLSIITFYNDQNSRESLIHNADGMLGASASITASQLDGYFSQNLNIIHSEAQLSDVIDYLATSASERVASEIEARVQKFINTLARQDSLYTVSISIMDTQGLVLADSNPLNVNSNQSNAGYFLKAMKTGLPYASPVQFDPKTGAASIYFATTVRNENGKILGVISKQFKASILQAIITQNTDLTGTNSFSILLDENHIRLADGSDHSLIYKTVIPLQPSMVADLQLKQLLPPGTQAELSTNLPGFEANLNRIKDQPFFATELHPNGLDVEQVATAKMKTQPWIIITAQSQKVFLEGIDVQTRNNISITLIVSLLVAGFGFLVSQTIAGPIARLTKTAKAVTEGDLFITASVETKDEIGHLALSFNTMTAQLRNLIDSLETRVTERSAIAESARAEAEASAAEAQAARKDIEAQIWQATGQTQLADAIRGEQNISKLARNIISQISQYLGAQAGALYLLEKETLKLIGSYSLSTRPGFDGKFQLGEGLVGQTAADNRAMLLTHPENATVISTGLVDFTPRQVLLVPFEEGGQVMGVFELATLTGFTSAHTDFLTHVSESVGIAFRTVQARQRLADVLMETQQQAEELQAQEEELRAANEELQSQAESLKAVNEKNTHKDKA